MDSAVIGGGFEYDGRELAPFDTGGGPGLLRRAEGQEACARWPSPACSPPSGTTTSVAAARLCREVMGEDVHVSVSSEIGSMGLIERENATILNAALYQVAQSFTEGFAQLSGGRRGHQRPGLPLPERRHPHDHGATPGATPSSPSPAAPPTPSGAPATSAACRTPSSSTWAVPPPTWA